MFRINNIKEDWSDYDFVMQAVTDNGRTWFNVEKSLKNNYDIILAAVSNNGRMLKHADEFHKKNHNIVLAAVKRDANALQYADESLKDDEYFISMLIHEVRFSYIIPHASKRIKQEYDEETLRNITLHIKG